MKTLRILVIGDTKAGKSTLLKKWCEIDPASEPIIRNQNGEQIRLPGGSRERGQHNIYDEYIFEKRPQYIFHDSCGFEGGSTSEMEDVKRFIAEKSASERMKEQLHLIWHCIPAGGPRLCIDEDIERIQLYHGAAGSVPVISIFTKLDTESNLYCAAARKAGKGLRETLRLKDQAPDRDNRINECIQRLNKTPCPPAGVVKLRDMDKPDTQCPSDLTEVSAQALNDINVLSIFIAMQRNSVELRIKAAIRQVFKERTKSMQEMLLIIGRVFTVLEKMQLWDRWDDFDWRWDFFDDDDWDWRWDFDFEWDKPKHARYNKDDITFDLDASNRTNFLIILGSLIIIHEHLFQFITATSTQQSLDSLSKDVAASFQANYYQQWEAEVRKRSWWMKGKDRIIQELTDLIMDHRMPLST